MGRRALWGLMTVAAVAVGAYAWLAVLVPAVGAPLAHTLLRDKTLRAVGHMLGGGTALAAGAFQFNRTLRNGHPAIHRLLGRVLWSQC